MRREVSVAGFLARAGAPVVAPSAELDPGPHTHDGISLSFWEYIEEVDVPLDATEAGHGLRACHELLTPLWNDWEDACLAPRALDLGCLEAAASVWGDDPKPVATALTAYGEIDAEALTVFVAARRFQGTMWSVLLG